MSHSYNFNDNSSEHISHELRDLVRRKRWQIAWDLYCRSKPENPSIALRFQVARILVGLSRFKSAQNFLDSILVEKPDDSRAHDLMGDIKATEGDYKAALICYGNALKTDRKPHVVYTKIANLYCETGRFTDAIEAIDRALAVQKDVASLCCKVKILLNMRRPQDAETLAQETVRLFPLDQGSKKYLDIAVRSSRSPDHTAFLPN